MSISSDEWIIRRASSEDALLVHDALRLVDQREIRDDNALEKFLNDPACYLLIATSRGEVVGSLNGYALTRPYRTEPQFLLYEVGVREEFRGRGIGTELVRAFIDEARKACAFELWVLTDTANTAALRVYEKSGLVVEDMNAQAVMLNLSL
jgi:ribosomal protein S18 acetylase RimI-like enzyme